MILALQYYEGDKHQALKLARLLADLEPRYRDDVVLGLVCQPGTTVGVETYDVVRHCQSKFPTEHVVSQFGWAGWADGSGQLWRGTMTHFYEQWSGRRPCRRKTSSSIFTFDGGDGAPLHRNWIDLLLDHHNITRLKGKSVSGTLCLEAPEHPNINGNMILDFSLWRDNPSLHNTPLGASKEEWWKIWDVYHAPIFIANASPSSVVLNCWNRTGVNNEIVRAASAESVWLHGYKDLNLCDVVRTYLLEYLEGRMTDPIVRRTAYDLGTSVLPR